jgi:hypothetical protein
MADEFAWNDAGDDLVVNGQLAIAVYENPKGDIVIRQEADHSRDEDSFVIVAKGNLPALVASL